MKKVLLVLVAVIGFGLSAYAGDCGCFKITNVETSGTNITVTIEKTCSLSENMTVKVVPTNDVAAILNQTAKYVEYKTGNPRVTVTFTCSEAGKVCSRNDFRLESCD